LLCDAKQQHTGRLLGLASVYNTTHYSANYNIDVGTLKKQRQMTANFVIFAQVA